MIKILVVIFIVVVVVRADDEDGQYVHDDSGKYIPDNSGLYRHDSTGGYRDDGSGKYSGANEIYRNEPTRYRNKDFPRAATLNVTPRPRPRPRPAAPAPFTPNLVLTSFPENDIRTSNNQRAKPSNNDFSQGNQNRQGGAVNYRQGRSDDSKWRILKQDGDVGIDGYFWNYETENGITAEESGSLANKGTDAEALRSKGFFRYTGPDNVLYTISYSADENGFVAQGNHLPTPPPIPAAILDAINSQKSPNRF